MRILLVLDCSHQPQLWVLPLQPSTGKIIPGGNTALKRTPRNYIADLNSGRAGAPLFLAFWQRLVNLETIHPPPLVLSIY